ncbi:cilia- and flagella-associated protein 74 isoform X1 [Phyllopteryx taeniolatus]|uniref:cilia- and flagella-associated protein 74 isoform X1 n=2 Tax=Phyllopteryx taeniolatus TaxID=161469 RepID=UPI002AD25994|nr:cilia- and flagella-associated protein 74 isoform X1 [Phyllopteryx taeniolatus]XP_061625260.1 cilia- and flagella-associated protein 74 isoform X1 [Phyllopteryx taeniolatus]XP_061625265.1 cilia- and flagella-associated protein 74 isoform X1 [Phyllopteryx taeniolatus]
MEEADNGCEWDVASDTCELATEQLSSDEETDGKEEDDFKTDDFKDGEVNEFPDLEWLEELYQENDSDDDLAGEPGDEKQRTFSATARMFKLRRNLDQLDNFHRQKESALLKAREDLNRLHHSIESLLEQRDVLEREIENQEAAKNSVAVIRLRAQQKNLCYELQREEEIEAHTNNELRQQELELSEVELEVGKFSMLRQEVQEEERVFQILKAQNAVQRLQQEKNNSHTLQLKIQNLKNFDRRNSDMLEKMGTLSEKKTEDGRTNRKVGAKYLKETIRRMQQQEVEREQKKRESMQKRIQAVKLLKSNIEATQENLRVRHSRAKANTLKKERQQKRLKESLHAQGINSTRHIYQQKRDEEMKQKQEEFKERQKARRLEIVEKLVEEEQLVKSRKAHQAPLPKTKTGHKILSPGRIREKLLRYLDSVHPSGTERDTTLRNFSASGSSSESEYQEDIIPKEMQHPSLPDSLEEPEFCGLWDQKFKLPLNEKTHLTPTEVKREPAVVYRKLSTTPKKVGGKQIKGPSFTSKPEVILFKDFEVGETYKKKVILTNISYITNHCKFLGISAQLQDFIMINFQPPGPLSTGMSCEMQITFHPSINEDLEGEVDFASAAGRFSVHVRCTIKRCDLEVDNQFIDFGSHVMGQIISRTITLTNKGALATRFSLDTTKPVPEIHQVQMPSHRSADTQQDTICADQNQSSASVATRELHNMDHVLDKSSVSRQCQRESQVSAADPRSASVSSGMHAQIAEGFSDSCDIRIGNVREGDIGPFESVKLEIIFSPTVPGEVKLDLYIKFSDPTSCPIAILVKGEGVGLPVWVVEPNIDMKICMFDHLYQEVVTLQSSTSRALKLTFDLWPEMRKHMEIIPRTGFLQAQSSFTAHLKFVPRNTLPQDANKYFDSATSVLEVPMAVQVAGQVQPVIYTVQAIVTSSDLKFGQSEVDFGYCSIYQSVKSSVRLTNMSLLPQEFGFVGLPEFVDVQPNDGFGTLLPQETLEIDIIFSANKAKEYRFHLSCKSGINRVFPLACRAMGVCPTLALSHSLVQFGPTAVGDHSTALLYLTYNQTVRNQSKQRPSAGARLFSFTPPQDSSISITPAAGRLLPGKRCLVLVTFKPKLEDRDIKEEALRLLLKAKQTNEEDIKKLLEEEAKREAEPNKGKKLSKSSKMSDFSKTATPIETPPPDNIDAGGQRFEEARASLLHSFTSRYSEYTIPCFVSDGDPPEEDRQTQPTWSPLNTVYLKLQCPAVQPPLVVVSSNIRNYALDFHQVAVGERVIKRFSAQNISEESLELRSSLLDIYGPFSLLNSLRGIGPGEKHTLVLAFCPTLEKKYCETLEVRCQKMTLAVTLRGEGIVPAITSSHSGGLLDFGYVMEKESTSQVLKLQNSSAVAVGFKAMLYSLSPSKTQGADEKVALLLGGYTDSKIQPVVGTHNYNGLSVFSVQPVEASIAARQSQDVVVTFHPDHPSVNYSDRLTIELVNKTKLCVLDLRGAASAHNMYLNGGDPLTVPIESLLPPLITSQPELAGQSEEMEIPVLVTLRASYSMGTIRPAVRELQIGCIRASKKGSDFLWDNLASLQQRGFSVEPSKGSVEAGSRHTIKLTWTPQSGHKPNEVVQMCVPLTVKGDETRVYNVTLMALVSTHVD